jgi:hypothetical protein
MARWLGNEVYTIGDKDPGHPMRKPQSLRIDEFRDDKLTDVTRAFDA